MSVWHKYRTSPPQPARLTPKEIGGSTHAGGERRLGHERAARLIYPLKARSRYSANHGTLPHLPIASCHRFLGSSQSATHILAARAYVDWDEGLW